MSRQRRNQLPPSFRQEETLLRKFPAWWRQLSTLQRRETRLLLARLADLRGFMPLLMKTRNGGFWSAQEKKELQRHLRQLSLLSPYLVLFLLPGSFLFLPAYAWWLDRRRRKRRLNPPSK
ncbi:MAG: hypothetical protein LBG69_01700 [Zoogloeaceae bacterium]|jgi:hypothetical protein|nr:hypothetical protein [Zoogloeaceae bacterium]